MSEVTALMILFGLMAGVSLLAAWLIDRDDGIRRAEHDEYLKKLDDRCKKL